MSSQPIGIFDSGIGGLTVLREIQKILPEESLLYLGDTARVPYGNKSPATVTRYALQNIQFLIQKNAKMVVVACNTASAFALEEVKKHFSIPILGVVEPGARGALKISRSKRIGVIGTEGTIQSETYTRALRREEPTAFVASVACPLFVPLVEEGWWGHDITRQTALHYLKEILAQKVDSLILGCTHYPLLKNLLKKIVGEEIALIDSAEETANEVAQILKIKDLQNQEKGNHVETKFYVTDSPERFQKAGALFLGKPISDVEHVDI